MTLHVQNKSIFSRGVKLATYHLYHHYLTSLQTNDKSTQQNVSPNSAPPGASASLSEMSEPALKRPKIGFHDNNRGWRGTKPRKHFGLPKMGRTVHAGGFGFEGHEWEHEMMSRWWQLQIFFMFTPIPWGR